jgi:uncharacterized membrane protein
MRSMDDKGSKLMYHARMFALAVLGALGIFLMVIGVVVIGLWLGVWHIYDR